MPELIQINPLTAAQYRTPEGEGLSLTTWAFLEILLNGPTGMSDLATQCLISTAGVTGVADSMTRQKLARRVYGMTDPETGRPDRRRIGLEILPAGRDALAAVSNSEPKPTPTF